jgi:hypothetical protein
MLSALQSPGQTIISAHNLGPVLAIVSIFLVVTSAIAVLIRVGTRLIKTHSLGHEEHFIIFATVRLLLATHIWADIYCAPGYCNRRDHHCLYSIYDWFGNTNRKVG